MELLDDNETIVQEFQRSANAQVILDYVCEFLNIVEKDYFGLRFQDVNRQLYWVDLNKSIARQLRGSNIVLRFRVRFYPSDVNVLKEEITRYQLFVQLRRDLLRGRLYCPQNEAAVLCGLILQSAIGDYNPEVHHPGYVSEYKLILKQTVRLEERIAEAHKFFSGLAPAEAELKFLKRASRLDMYGFDPYSVIDEQGRSVYIGVTHRGILINHMGQVIHHIKWSEFKKSDYLGKELYVTPVSTYVTPNFMIYDSSGQPLISKPAGFKFRCPSASFAKHLWRHILSQQAFFTENNAKHIKLKYSKSRIPLLSRGSTFRFPVSRVLHEIETDGSRKRYGPAPMFVRYELEKHPPRQQLVVGSKYDTLPQVPSRNVHDARVTTTVPEDKSLTDVAEGHSSDNGSVIVDEEFFEAVDQPSSPIPPPVTEHDPSISNVASSPDENLPSNESSLEAKFIDTSTTSSKVLSYGETVEVSEACSTLRRPSTLRDTNADNFESVVIYIARIMLPYVLVILLVSTFVIAVFESDSGWITSFARLDHLRHFVHDAFRSFHL